jgi:hypothetical protein
MRCPKCGYHSFESLDSCRKCGQDLNEHKVKYNIRGFMTSGTAETATPPEAVDDASTATPDAAEDESPDFGFDFLEEEEDRDDESPDNVSLGGNDQEISLDQPFDVDSETIPDDAPATKKGKRDKGSEFAF